MSICFLSCAECGHTFASRNGAEKCGACLAIWVPPVPWSDCLPSAEREDEDARRREEREKWADKSVDAADLE